MKIQEKMSIYDKLNILTDAAKYDVACTSSGVSRKNDGTGIGSCKLSGICHSFSADGRCISLLKILFTNECIYDCKYCINRRSNDVVRTSFTPDEICTLTIEFYRRNYIEGLFLSSGVLRSPNYTMELIYAALYKLRTEYVPLSRPQQVLLPLARYKSNLSFPLRLLHLRNRRTVVWNPASWPAFPILPAASRCSAECPIRWPSSPALPPLVQER